VIGAGGELCYIEPPSYLRCLLARSLAIMAAIQLLDAPEDESQYTSWQNVRLALSSWAIIAKSAAFSVLLLRIVLTDRFAYRTV
jgi:hypothetical protein